MARTNKKGGNTAGLKGWSAFTPQEKSMNRSSQPDGRAKSSSMQMKSPKDFNPGLRAASKAGKLDNNPKFKAAVDNSSPQKVVPAIMAGLTAADLLYQGYKYVKKRSGKAARTVKNEINKRKRADLMKRYNALPPEMKKKIGPPPTMPKAGGTKTDKPKSTIGNAGKKTKKLTYAEAKKNDPNLGAYVAERKKHKKGSPEYKAVQAKINAAYRI
tara:strand:+ start:227 stop:868 length:642 start_codon:yes stop_codon:yes gene_type:complete